MTIAVPERLPVLADPLTDPDFPIDPGIGSPIADQVRRDLAEAKLDSEVRRLRTERWRRLWLRLRRKHIPTAEEILVAKVEKYFGRELAWAV